MAGIPLAKLEKLSILPYKKALLQKDGSVVFDEVDTSLKFTAMYNPEKLSVTNGQFITEKKNIGDPNSRTEMLTGANSTFNVELFFDGTGASLSGGLEGAIGAAAAIKTLKPGFVRGEVDKFYKSTLWADMGTHHSYYLHVIWGKGFYFSCQLQSATTNYLLFDRQGNPIRATISASFIECSDKSSDSDKERAGRSGFLSPDLTKVHEVKAGDTIFNIAQKEYDDESYYLEIAQINNLKNYRKLIPGQKLILPSIKGA